MAQKLTVTAHPINDNKCLNSMYVSKTTFADLDHPSKVVIKGKTFAIDVKTNMPDDCIGISGEYRRFLSLSVGDVIDFPSFNKITNTQID